MVSYRCCSVGPAATRKLYSKVVTLLWSRCVFFSCCLQVTRQRWASQDWKGINSSKLHSTLVNREQFQAKVCDLSCNLRISKKQYNLVDRLQYSEAALNQAKACKPFSKDAENEFEMFIQIFVKIPRHSNFWWYSLRLMDWKRKNIIMLADLACRNEMDWQRFVSRTMLYLKLFRMKARLMAHRVSYASRVWIRVAES